MRDGSHLALPDAELPQFRQDLQDEANAHDLKIDIEVKPGSNAGTVDVSWHVAPKAAAAPPSAPAAAAPAAAPAAATSRVSAVTAAGAVDVLGKLSEQFESRGSGDVSGGQGDPGGVSYGSWQMTSRPNGGTVQRFIGDPAFPFTVVFRDLTPGTKPFSDAWRTLANNNPVGFKAAQHAFIKVTHFDPVAKVLLDQTALDVATRSQALQDCVWSTAVQHGPNTSICSDVCRTVLRATQPNAGNAFDEAFIRGVYAERGRKDTGGTLVHFPHVDVSLYPGLESRFEHECAAALKELQHGGT